MPPKEKTYPLSQIAKTAATKTEQCLQIFTKYSPTASHMKCSKKKRQRSVHQWTCLYLYLYLAYCQAAIISCPSNFIFIVLIIVLYLMFQSDLHLRPSCFQHNFIPNVVVSLYLRPVIFKVGAARGRQGAAENWRQDKKIKCKQINK